MSFDRAVWDAAAPMSDAEALDLYERLCESPDTALEGKSERIERFYHELTSLYPEIDTLPEDEIDASPWSAALDRSGMHVLMPIVWPRANELDAVVRRLARQHELVRFDPQSATVHLPERLRHGSAGSAGQALSRMRPRGWWRRRA